MVIDGVEVFLLGSGRRCTYLADLDTLVNLDDAECQENRYLKLTPRIPPMR